jgi:hypothetical protein
MFPFFPYKRIVIPTSLTIEKCVSLVSTAISPYRTINTWFSSSSKEFEGSVNEQGFKIQKVIHNRNSFLPVLNGKFIQFEKGTKIEVRLSLDTLVLVFTSFWLAGMGGVFLLLVIGSISAGAPNKFVWYPLAGIVFFYFMILVGFGSYAKRTEEFIMNLFESYKVE